MSNTDKQINYWKESAEHNRKTALDLFKTRHYDACLFFCHLALEKLLKGLVVELTKEPAPYVHDLEKLALIAELPISKEQSEYLKTITRFNIGGRYDDEKLAFYKSCTKEYAEKYLNVSNDLRLWLKKQYRKK